jgi:hypothetical protein
LKKGIVSFKDLKMAFESFESLIMNSDAFKEEFPIQAKINQI